MQHVQQLKNYLDLLLCLYQSNHATPATKKVGPSSMMLILRAISFICAQGPDRPTMSPRLKPWNMLLELPKEFEELFDRMLGDWKTEPFSFELKEGAKPYHGRPYPVPKVRKEAIIKELN
jgi:hypothetical protein